ncbi:MAG: cyclic nucleotide-binding domain-containing protein [Gammaproteobacteria bacterium]
MPTPAQLFLSFCSTRNYPREFEIFTPKEIPDKVYCLIDGDLEWTACDPQGKEVLLANLYPGDFYGITEFLCGTGVPDTVLRAKTQCTIAEISHAKLRRLLESESPEFRFGVICILAEKQSSMVAWLGKKVGHFGFLGAHSRIMKALIELGESPNAKTSSEGVVVKTTRRRICIAAGCCVALTGRIVSYLKSRKMISVKKREKIITIHSVL